MRGLPRVRTPSLLTPDEELRGRLAIIQSPTSDTAAQTAALDELRAGRIETVARSEALGELERAVAAMVCDWSVGREGTALSARVSSALRLLVQLLSHTCSVATLSHVLHDLCDAPHVRRGAAPKRLLLALEIAVKQSQGPSRYLALRGGRCALKLPLAPGAWPSAGLTFSVLFRCEGQRAETGVRLLHATGGGGTMALSVVLRGAALVVDCVVGAQRARLVEPNLAPRPGAWHWLSLVIGPLSNGLLGLSGGDNVGVYLDAHPASEPCLSGRAPYPSSDRVTGVAVGDSPDAADQGMVVDVGAIVLYGSALEPAAIRAAHLSGGAGWATGRAADVCGTPFASRPPLRRAALVAVDLRCWSVERKSCPDCAEARRSDDRAARVVGEAHRGKFRARTSPTVALFRLGGMRHLLDLLRRDGDDAAEQRRAAAEVPPPIIDLLGSIDLLEPNEPLVTTADQLLTEPTTTAAETTAAATTTTTAVPRLGAAGFAQALSLAAVVLRLSPMQRQQFLLGGRGLATVAEALQRLPVEYLTTRLVDAAAALVEALQRSGPSVSTAAAEAVLFDFRVWAAASREVTLHLLSIVEMHAQRGPPALRATISVAKLRACYRTREAEVRTAAGRIVALLRAVPGADEASDATVEAEDRHSDAMRAQIYARAAAAQRREREQRSELRRGEVISWALRTDRGGGAGRMRVQLEASSVAPGRYDNACQSSSRVASPPRRRLSSATGVAATALGEQQEGYGFTAHMVTPMNATLGTLRLRNRLGWRLVWSASRLDESGGKDRDEEMHPSSRAAARCADSEVRVADVETVIARRHLLRHVAIEIFCRNGETFFFAFRSLEERTRFHRELTRAKGGSGGGGGGGGSSAESWSSLATPSQLVSQAAWTQAWCDRRISNFDYLMILNTAAGRTYNDLTQYFVFPWVLADYASAALDLSDASAFRDLRKPVGALNPARLGRVVERFIGQKEHHAGLGSPGGAGSASGVMPPFMYGTHYSHPGAVIDFMLRIEPFTSLHVLLQGGRFDIADRLFADVGEAWAKCSGTAGDVREVIPELYYLPTLCANRNALPLGERQDGTKVTSVSLPPWAHGSPHTFVRLARAALESDRVSENLHHWIDLIFGAKQRGVEAERANNVFFHLTYEGAVDWDALTEPTERRAVEAQINSFGQCPSQLFKKAHPQRLALSAALAARYPRAHSTARFASTRCVRRAVVALHSVRSPIVFCAFVGPPSNNSIAVTLDRGGGAGLFHYVDDNEGEDEMAVALEPIVSSPLHAHETNADELRTSPSSVETLSLELATLAATWLEGAPANANAVSSKWKKAPKLKVLARSLFVVSAGHWDGGLRLWCIDAANGAIRMQMSLVAPLDSRTTVCSAVSATPPLPARATTTTFVGAGTECGVVVVWEFRGKTLVLPPRVCVGHESAVTALALAPELDLVVSGSINGGVLLHALRSGDLVRRFRFTEAGVDAAPFASLRALSFVLGGRIAALTSTALLLFDMNDGTVLARRVLIAEEGAAAEEGEEEEESDEEGEEEELLPQIVPTRDGRFVLTAHRRGVEIRWAHTLRVARRVRHKPATSGAFASFALSPDERCIIVGSANGRVVIHGCHFGFGEPIAAGEGDGGKYVSERGQVLTSRLSEGGGVGDLLSFSSIGGGGGASDQQQEYSRARQAMGDLLSFDSELEGGEVQQQRGSAGAQGNLALFLGSDLDLDKESAPPLTVKEAAAPAPRASGFAFMAAAVADPLGALMSAAYSSDVGNVAGGRVAMAPAPPALLSVVPIAQSSGGEEDEEEEEDLFAFGSAALKKKKKKKTSRRH